MILEEFLLVALPSLAKDEKLRGQLVVIFQHLYLGTAYNLLISKERCTVLLYWMVE